MYGAAGSILAVPLQADWIPTSVGELIAQYTGLIAGVVKFVVGFVVVYFLGRAVLVPLVKRVLGNRGFDPTVRSLGESVAGALVLLLAIAIAFTLAGYGQIIAAFATLSGALALALGFAAQDLLSNFVAGVFILKDKPFDVGDWIEWTDGSGEVRDIDLRVTRVRTFDNERITVPNSTLANNAVTNPVAYDSLREKFVFGIGYEDDIQEATDAILDEARKTDGILDDPEPAVRVTELADSYVGLQSRFWIGDPNRGGFMRVRSEFITAVKERFDEEGIDMPYPYRQLTGGIGVDGDVETRRAEASGDD